MRWVPDRTGRFAQRPYCLAKELDADCELAVTSFLRTRHGSVLFPISTDDLTVMIEDVTEDLDSFADLTALGIEVEGVTDFYKDREPRVRIDRRLAADARRANRLRTTLTHELGHVRFHGFLWDFSEPQRLFDDDDPPQRVTSCRRDTMVSAPTADWMEWQASYASGALLIPVTYAAEVVAEFQRRAGRTGRVQLGTTSAAELVLEVQQRFQVSDEAARVRLTKLGHLTATAQPDAGLFESSL
jgi:hypothetical protein